MNTRLIDLITIACDTPDCLMPAAKRVVIDDAQTLLPRDLGKYCLKHARCKIKEQEAVERWWDALRGVTVIR